MKQRSVAEVVEYDHSIPVACPVCQGFGRIIGIDMDLVVPDPSKTLRQGAILPWTFPRWREHFADLVRVSKDAGIPLDVPFKNLTKDHVSFLLNGCKGYDIIPAWRVCQ
ncbi:MAG: hypothetical protein HGB17_10220 [Syntrophobacteraceae bacterium]|nr:hypothetical protein [Syntrophobacteraceae bacterium]